VIGDPVKPSEHPDIEDQIRTKRERGVAPCWPVDVEDIFEKPEQPRDDGGRHQAAKNDVGVDVDDPLALVQAEETVGHGEILVGQSAMRGVGIISSPVPGGGGGRAAVGGGIPCVIMHPRSTDYATIAQSHIRRNRYHTL